MDFGRVSLEGLVGPHPESGVSSQVVSDPEAIKQKSNGSGFLKQERSGSGEDEWRSSKMARPDGFDEPKSMLHQQGTCLLRSNSLLSGGGGGGGGGGGQHHNMLNFSLPKSEVPFLSKNGGLVCRSAQNSAIPYYQHSPYAYSRNTGYGSASSNAGMHMHGSFPGIRGPFTPSQWIELEHQALIYKYIMANVPVPSNLLIALKKSINPFGLSGTSSFYAPNSFGWGSFHLGFSGNNDPEPGRCRRTDGKKWRCSRDAVPDQKYCERHINRGRHRSRKHVEGQTGHAISGSTTSKVTPIASTTSASVVSSSGASNTLNVMQHQFNSLQPGATNPSTNSIINRRQDPQDLSMISPAINLMSKDSVFSIPKHAPLDEFSQPEFGLVSYDTFLNPSQRSSYFNPRDYNSFMDFGDQKTHDQHSLRQFIDNWPKDRSNRITTAWPEELKSDWTQLSMSIPMTSNFSSTSSPTRQEKLALSPLRLSRELDPTEMGLGLSSDLSETFQKQTNCVPASWGSSMGGPLGEVLNSTSGTGGACKNSSALKLVTEVWDGNTQLGSSPTGVLQKTTFVSLSNSSSGSSPRADKKTNECGSLCDDGLGSTLASSFSMPSL